MRGLSEDTYIKFIDGRWYAFGYDSRNYQVYSIGRDDPAECGCWFARATDSGIKYVASSSPSRHAAYMKARRNGHYCGEL